MLSVSVISDSAVSQQDGEQGPKLTAGVGTGRIFVCLMFEAVDWPLSDRPLQLPPRTDGVTRSSGAEHRAMDFIVYTTEYGLLTIVRGEKNMMGNDLPW